MASDDVMELLRGFKQACIKIRDSLVAGHENVSPSPRKTSCCTNLEDSGARWDNYFHYPCSNTPSPVVCEQVEVPEGFWEECGPNKRWPDNESNFALTPLEEKTYRNLFYNTEHWNYYVEDEPDVGPCLLSIKQEAQESRTVFRVIVRSPDHYVHGVLLPNNLSANRYDKDDIVATLGKEMRFSSSFKFADKPELSEEIMKLDETFLKGALKVGALLVRPGQNSEEDMLKNQHVPGGPFDKLLSFLGDRVTLRGFNRFLGGLDSNNDLTGKESVYTEFEGNEIMFHVSTLLPYTDNDHQQVNRKRHIGNDITCLVFLEGPDCHFNPLWIRSHFLHSFIVVQLLSETTSEGLPLYRVSTISRNLVPPFGPQVKHHDIFPAGPLFRNFLLTKIVNSNRACYYAPKFLRLTCRTRLQLLAEFVSSLSDEGDLQKKYQSKRCYRRGSWIPQGAARPPSSFFDSVRDSYDNADRLADDLTVSLSSALCSNNELTDTTFLVGPSRVPMYGVKAILACRSRVMAKLFSEGTQQWNMPSGTRRSSSPPPTPRYMVKKRHSTGEAFEYMAGCDEAKQQPTEPYVIENIEEDVFRELLCYFMTGSCNIHPLNIVGLACAAEYFDVPDLRQACLDHLIRCLSSKILCQLLNQLEKHLTCQTAKSMLLTVLQYADGNAENMLRSRDFLHLSEHMLLVVMQRDIQASEIMKVKGLLAWAEQNTTAGANRHKVLQPVLKNIQLQFISAADLMKVVVPCGLFSSEKVMEALAYQVDPGAFDS